MITKLDLKPIKESWLKENSKYDEIMAMETDRVSKAKEIVELMLYGRQYLPLSLT